MANTATELTVQRLENLAADKTVSPPVMRRGLVGKADDGNYYDIKGSTEGGLHVVPNGSEVDANNSTETPLLANATFTGTSTEILHFSAIALLVSSDVASATGGLVLEFSPDGTDWHAGESYTIPAGSTKFFTPPVQARYYRIVYTNGGTDQTAFHLHPLLKKTPIKWSSHNIQDTLNDEDDGELNVSVIKLRTAKDNYVSGSATNSGNFKTSLEELESGISSNSNSQLNVTQFLADGTEGLTQAVKADANNSSTTNLASGATFTGTATSTLGVVGLQWSLYTTQNCTVYVEQSPDGTNWDISYHFDYIASKGGEGETVQATQAYWRIRVTNEGTLTTTAFRLQGVLCPIAVPLPSALSDDARLKTESTLSGRENTERHVWVNPTNELAISPVYRMVGTNFDGSTLDPNFWSDDECLRDGTVAQSNGEVKLLTNTTANGLSILQSVRRGRFVAGSAMIFEGAFSFKTAGTANNTRRVGVYTIDGSLDVEDGFFFQLDGTTFSIGYARDGSVTEVDSGDFNGNLGLIWTPTVDTYYKLTIEYTPMGAFWYVDGTLLHKVKAGHPSAYMTLPITMENENIGNITTEIELHCVGAYIARQGELFTNQTSKFLQGTGTTICKRGAGVVKGIVISAVVDNTEIDFYDGTTTGVSDTLLWASGGIQAKTDYEPIPVDLFGLPFSNGLTIEISEENCNVLVIYE